MMKKALSIILLLLLFSLSYTYAIENTEFRFGYYSGFDLSAIPETLDIPQIVPDSPTEMYSGLYWELIFDKFGFGMTSFINSFYTEESSSEDGREWWIDWIATLDFKYHFFGNESFIDPFAEFALGCAGRNKLQYKDKLISGWDISGETWEYIQDPYIDRQEYSLTSFSMLGQIGIGCAIKYQRLYLGIKGTARLNNDGILYDEFFTYPLRKYHLSLYTGFSF